MKKSQLFLLGGAAVILLILITQVRSIVDPGVAPDNNLAAVSASEPTNLPLIQFGDLIYEGAFRLPADAGDTFDYGGNGVAFNPAKGTLIVAGHIYRFNLAEISIPTPSKSTNLNDLPRASFVQQFAPSKIGGIGKDYLIGGLLPWGNDLIANAFIYYDAGKSQQKSHYRLSLQLNSSSPAVGPYKIGSYMPGLVAGYMSPIPEEWREALGGPAITGQGPGIPIITRTSFGPAATVFDPAQNEQTSAKMLIGYPCAESWTSDCHATIGGYDTNGTMINGATSVVGVIFPPGTSTILFIGNRGAGKYCYGEGAACGDPTSYYKGIHGYPYTHTMFAYDAREAARVKRGEIKPWDVVPYARWDFDLPLQGAARSTTGATYDPATKRLFIGAIPEGGMQQPIIHVYKLAVGTATPPPPPTPPTPTPPTPTPTPPTPTPPTPVPTNCPCSIWSSSTTPTTLDTGDTRGIEYGLKFKSEASGYITAVRFYKGSGNTGTHTGAIWSENGTKLGSVTFTGESSSGWQQANFANPIAISANTTYIVSYYAPVGRNSINISGLTSLVTNSPLQALAGGGVYHEGGGFPTDTYSNSNYWVDVVFSTSGTPTPTPPTPTPPTPPPASLPGDLNNDGIVNSLDWSIMNSKWFSSDAAADLNHDGIVNSIDFSILNNNWFKTS